MNDIIDNNLYETYPEPIAGLIDYLSHCELSESIWREATSLIDRLHQSDISDALKTRLHQIFADFGLD